MLLEHHKWDQIFVCVPVVFHTRTFSWAYKSKVQWVEEQYQVLAY